MRVIHGVWAHGLSNHGALCLWAEDPDLPPRPAAGAAGRAPGPAASVRLPGRRAGRPAGRGRSPGSASTAAGDAVRKAVHDELTLRLPSAGGAPLASPELVRPEAPAAPGAPAGSEAPAAPVPARRGRVSLAGWRVPVLAFGPGAALALLGGSGWSGSGPSGDTAMAGGSLTYLAAVARFAAGLAARGRVLPVLESEGDGLYGAVAAGARRCRRTARP